MLERRYLVIAVLGRGGYFGVGEDLHKSMVISDEKVFDELLTQKLILLKLNC